jgi:putative FmdB family regulatory protein
MPIYAYKCESCGFAKDVLQKMSDPPLEVCPACAQTAFRKQVTAAGFQLKGSGWYVTDFKGGGAAQTSVPAPADGAAAAPAVEAAPGKPDPTPSTGAAPAASGT